MSSGSSTSFTLPNAHHPCRHSWNADGTLCCLAVECDLKIFNMSGSKPQLVATLNAHKHRVTGVDWNLNTNQIVSCGEDRNAYVWNAVGDEWKPSLVVLRVNRAALCVKWSPHGNKFAVGTSAKSVMVCNYEEEQDWWVSKSIRKMKSSVTCLDWHPNNLMLAAGGTDMKCRIYNAYLENDDQDGDDAICEFYADKKSFGQVLEEFPSMGFVNSCSFSPDGQKLVFASQSAQVTFVNLMGADNDSVVTVQQCMTLPFNCVIFHPANPVVLAGGHNENVYTLTIDDDCLASPEKLEGGKKKSGPSKNSAFAKFQNMATTGKEKGGKKAGNHHSFAISDLAWQNGSSAFTSIANGDNTLIAWS